MDTIIEKLYEMYTEKYQEITVNKYEEKKKVVYRNYEMLRSQLSLEQAKELDRLLDEQTTLFIQELEDNFIEGFKTGSKLMCEIYAEEIANAKEKI